jgi:hypothetical protein
MAALRLIPPTSTPWSRAERETMLLRTKTMDEIRDAATWLGVTFAEAYAERREVWARRYYFLR